MPAIQSFLYNINIATNGNYSLSHLWQKCIENRQYIELY